MADFTAQQRRDLAKSGQAMSSGSFPIRNRADLANAIRAVGRAKGATAGHNLVRRYIIRRARALGAVDMIPDTWAGDGSLKPSS